MGCARLASRGSGHSAGRLLFGLFLLVAASSAGCGDSSPEADRQDARRAAESSRSAAPGQPGAAGRGAAPPAVDTLASLVAERERLDETVWAAEQEAQHYEAAIVDLWDRLLAARDGPEDAKLRVLRDLPLQRVTLGDPVSEESLEQGIRRIGCGGTGQTVDRQGWLDLLDRWHADGLRLVQSEWHHAAFEPAAGTQGGDPKASAGPRSTVRMALHLVHAERGERIIVRGRLGIRWEPRSDADGRPVPREVDARDLEILTRGGSPGFREVLSLTEDTSGGRRGLHPLLVHDLDDDGLSEIVLGGVNRVFWNRGGGQYEQRPLLKHPPRMSKAGLLADLDNDGRQDYATVDARAGLILYSGDGRGGFPGRPRQLAPVRFDNPQVITGGDIDADGDLDLWVGQHKAAYLFGQMPTPYYDANDGFPAYLLLNDGRGNFRDATEEAGLARLRHRRTHAASFLDLNHDQALDLLVVSDFAGIDAYLNDGGGRFRLVTDALVDQRHNFGMSCSFADFDLDGRLDFYITGMASTTARRLQRLGLHRENMPDVDRMRPVMGYGSRMYLAREDHYVQPKFADQVNRTGWTWGVTALDFDNDGDRDIYLANGHSSGKSTKDHCWHFWCHDIYTNSSELDPVRAQLFRSVLSGYEDGSESWDGYQKNVLLMNRRGEAFVQIGFLLGVAHEYDARAVVGDDLDNDGRVDLLVIEQNRLAGTESLHVYRNELDLAARHWIGVELREGKPGSSPLGAKIRVVSRRLDQPDQQWVQPGQIVSGDSFSAQHPARLHFGLGEAAQVERIEVIWPDGRTRRIEQPAVDRYHRVDPP